MENNKWTYELYNEEYWTSGEYFDTKEEAIEAGKQELIDLDDEDMQSFWVGRVIDYIPRVNVHSIIDDLVDDAEEHCGEASDRFLNKITEEQYKRLGEIMNEALNKWLTETNNQPNFFELDDIENISIKEQ